MRTVMIHAKSSKQNDETTAVKNSYYKIPLKVIVESIE